MLNTELSKQCEGASVSSGKSLVHKTMPGNWSLCFLFKVVPLIDVGSESKALLWLLVPYGQVIREKRDDKSWTRVLSGRVRNGDIPEY